MKNSRTPLMLILLCLKRGRGDGLKDPPTLYCEEKGGTIKTRYARDGFPMHICNFEDGTACEEMCLHRGGCSQGDTLEYTAFCREKGGQLISSRIEWGTDGNVPWIDPDVAWCIFPDGSACSERAFSHLYCHKASGEWRDIFRDYDVPFEMFCEINTGNLVRHGYVWDTEDGKPPTWNDDFCAFEDLDRESLEEVLQPYSSTLDFLFDTEDGTLGVREYRYYDSTCDDNDRDEDPVNDSTWKEIMASFNAYLSAFCNDNGGTSETRTDQHGDEYVLCIFGEDKVCDGFIFYEGSLDESEPWLGCGKGKPPFPVFCERSGGKLADDEISCTYNHKNLSEWVSEQYLKCYERNYYRWDCDVGATSFPFAEIPTPSMPCADGYEAEIRRDEDNSQYAICVNKSSRRVCAAWNSSELANDWYCSKGAPMFEEYCIEQNHHVWSYSKRMVQSFKGKLTSQNGLPVCTYPKLENDSGLSSYWIVSSDDDGMVCTERFYYDNGGCLPFDVLGADGPAAAVASFQSILLTVLEGFLLLQLL